MSEKQIVMGIDTSNYTTSVALMYTDGELIANLKRPLTVKAGERGLRQSDAVFSHVKNLPDIMDEAKKYLNGKQPRAIGVSTRPRNVEGSYMPCFLTGLAAAKSISAATAIPIYEFSHQCGHLMAAIYSSENDIFLNGEPFSAFHVSGGTTEMLRVKFNGRSFDSELLGGTSDLNAGQAIDRIGVMMGLSFPCGAAMEELALNNTAELPGRRSKAKDLKINLSGLENLAIDLYKKTEDKRLVSAFVFNYIAESLASLATAYEDTYGQSKFLFAGGVMCNSMIRKTIANRFDASFATRETSSDNAVGIAALTRINYNK